MTIQASTFVNLAREWPLLLCLLLLLMGAVFWPSTEKVPSSKDVRGVVASDLERDIGLTIKNLEVLQIRPSADGNYIASVRFQNDLIDLRFRGSPQKWSWEGVSFRKGMEFTVTDYVHYLRHRNEQDAVDFVRLIQTAQVAAKTRAGIYLPVLKLIEEGFLPSNVMIDGLSGYLFTIDVSESNYAVFLTPSNYPTSATCSFFGDSNLEVRGRDIRGKRASSQDPIVQEDSLTGSRERGIESYWHRSEKRAC